MMWNTIYALRRACGLSILCDEQQCELVFDRGTAHVHMSYYGPAACLLTSPHKPLAGNVNALAAMCTV